MSLITSLVNKVSKAFSKTQSSDLLGISLRQNSLAYCYIAHTSNSSTKIDEQNPIVSRCDQIENLQGDFNKALTDFSEQQKVQGQCQLVLSIGQYQIIQTDKPDVPENEIIGALKWQIKDQVTYSPEDMVLDYFYAPKQPDGTEKLYVICASLSILKPLVDHLINDDITLTTITVEEFAFARLLPFSDDAQLMLCQQPDEEIFILIVKQGRICFHRRLRGFAQIANKSEEELAFGTIDSLSLEIQKSTDYFERQLKQSVIKSIKVILPISTENHLIKKLAENTHIKVSSLVLADEFSSSRHLAAAIGATIDDSISLVAGESE
jgi:MSHA biogenesis protein MshI